METPDVPDECLNDNHDYDQTGRCRGTTDPQSFAPWCKNLYISSECGIGMDATERAEVLKVISDIQNNGGRNGTSSVTVQIGGVNDNTDIVEKDSLYIQNAPAKIISELEGMGYSLSVSDDGVRVRSYKR